MVKKINEYKMKRRTSKGNQVPGAWITTPIDKGRKSIKNSKKSGIKSEGTVYLNNGDEFLIELFNPLTMPVAAKIEINGIEDNSLVIRPGERFYLDCYMETNKKFTFNTYDVKSENIESTVNNGTVKVTFYEEKSFKNNYQILYGNRTIFNSPNYSGYDNLTMFNNSISGKVTLDTFSTTSLNCNYSSDNIETGRVEGGELSEQKFVEYDGEFKKIPVSITEIQLLPSSRYKELIKVQKPTELLNAITQLHDLREQGIITDDEFNEKKKIILDKIV